MQSYDLQSYDLQSYDQGQAASVVAFPSPFCAERRTTAQRTERALDRTKQALGSGTKMFLLFSAGAALVLGALGLLMLL